MNSGSKALQKQRGNFPGSEVTAPQNNAFKDAAGFRDTLSQQAPASAPMGKATFPYPPGAGNENIGVPQNTAFQDAQSTRDILSQPGVLQRLFSLLTGGESQPQGMSRGGFGKDPMDQSATEASDDQDMAMAYGLK